MRALRYLIARAVGLGDPVLAALLAGTALLDVLTSGESLFKAAIAAAVAVPLVARRRAPMTALALVVAASYVALAWGPDVGGRLQGLIALNLALYSVAAHCARRRAGARAGRGAPPALLFWGARPRAGGRPA